METRTEVKKPVIKPKRAEQHFSFRRSNNDIIKAYHVYKENYAGVGTVSAASFTAGWNMAVHLMKNKNNPDPWNQDWKTANGKP